MNEEQRLLIFPSIQNDKDKSTVDNKSRKLMLKRYKSVEPAYPVWHVPSLSADTITSLDKNSDEMIHFRRLLSSYQQIDNNDNNTRVIEHESKTNKIPEVKSEPSMSKLTKSLDDVKLSLFPNQSKIVHYKDWISLRENYIEEIDKMISIYANVDKRHLKRYIQDFFLLIKLLRKISLKILNLFYIFVKIDRVPLENIEDLEVYVDKMHNSLDHIPQEPFMLWIGPNLERNGNPLFCYFDSSSVSLLNSRVKLSQAEEDRCKFLHVQIYDLNLQECESFVNFEATGIKLSKSNSDSMQYIFTDDDVTDDLSVIFKFWFNRWKRWIFLYPKLKDIISVRITRQKRTIFYEMQNNVQFCKCFRSLVLRNQCRLLDSMLGQWKVYVQRMRKLNKIYAKSQMSTLKYYFQRCIVFKNTCFDLRNFKLHLRQHLLQTHFKAMHYFALLGRFKKKRKYVSKCKWNMYMTSVIKRIFMNWKRYCYVILKFDRLEDICLNYIYRNALDKWKLEIRIQKNEIYENSLYQTVGLLGVANNVVDVDLEVSYSSMKNNYSISGVSSKSHGITDNKIISNDFSNSFVNNNTLSRNKSSFGNLFKSSREKPQLPNDQQQNNNNSNPLISSVESIKNLLFYSKSSDLVD